MGLTLPPLKGQAVSGEMAIYFLSVCHCILYRRILHTVSVCHSHCRTGRQHVLGIVLAIVFED